jgi:outer membrane protein assembly factor BamD
MAILAEIGVADSMYSDKEYATAENAYMDFIALHPLNENVPYAIYQLGMCHYNQMESVDRDQTETIAAKKEWERLIARYPESKFSTMAGKMLREVRQKLAEREFYVGNYYFKQKKYQAALVRFEKVASDYANLGLDYKIEYYINETKAKIAEEEKLKLKEEAEKIKKEEEKKKKEEEKKQKAEEKKKKAVKK